MRSLALLVALTTAAAACASAATPQRPGPVFDGERAFEHLKRVVEIGPRPAGSPGAARTRAYIIEQLAALGIKAEEQPFEAKTPIGPVQMANVRALIPGRGTGRLIFAGHYDTKLFKEFTFVGANDGGSSTAFLIELARTLKARDNAIPIEIVFFDGEEAFVEWSLGSDSTYGSRHYVQAAKGDGSLKDIRALMLVDMIGDRELTIKRDDHSTPWLNDIIWAAARRLGRSEFVDQTTVIEDDHIPFLEAGVPAVDIIDLEYPDESMRYWHTAEDTLDKVSARSLQVVGDVLLEALPGIEARVADTQR
ncbi:MAG: M28 family peptidase [Acidobacteria bacterium]|nr:M28 family peptidase [Acidobacteriota bacterium]